MRLQCQKRETKFAGVPPVENRLHVHDRNTKLRFLVDSGSAVSIIPVKAVKKPLSRQSLVLHAANSTPIPTFGQHKTSLNLGLRREIVWNFIIADVNTAILGADALTHYEIIIDLRHRRITDTLTSISAIGSILPATVYGVTCEPTFAVPPGILGERYCNLIKKYANIISPPGTMATAPDLEVRHIIQATGAPAFERPRRLSGERLTAAKEEFLTLLERGIVRPSSSQWASPIHMVPKQNGKWRVTGDYRRLNACTIPDRYPIIEDILQESRGKIFSVIDLQRSFYQIRVADNDIQKTAVTTPFGAFEFIGMPMGTRNSAQTLQRTMNHLLRNLPFVRCYIDDLIVFSDSHDNHLEHLQVLLDTLSDARLNVNWEKCTFGASEVIFAGYRVSKEGYKPPRRKIEAIQEFPKPTNTSELRRFLGMLNFYRHCLPHATELQLPLTELLKGNAKKKTIITWSNEADRAFELCKTEIEKATKTTFLSPDAPLALRTDASANAIGAALDQQQDNDVWAPLGFFSRKLSATEQRYSSYDRELLAVFAAIKHFARILEGRNFTIFTDHKPLTYAFAKSSDKASPRQSQQLDYIAQFDTKFIYTPGPENIVADALSRGSTVNMPAVFDTKSLSTAQANDEQLPHILNNSRVNVQRLTIDNESIFCIVHENVIKPYLPESLRRRARDAEF